MHKNSFLCQHLGVCAQKITQMPRSTMQPLCKRFYYCAWKKSLLLLNKIWENFDRGSDHPVDIAFLSVLGYLALFVWVIFLCIWAIIDVNHYISLIRIMSYYNSTLIYILRTVFHFITSRNSYFINCSC